MATYLTFEAILQNGETEQEALDYAAGMAWCEVECSEQTIGHARYIDTVEGVGVYYDYGADYYFFTEEQDYC